MATETQELLGELDSLKADLVVLAPEPEAPVAPGAPEAPTVPHQVVASEPVVPVPLDFGDTEEKIEAEKARRRVELAARPDATADVVNQEAERRRAEAARGGEPLETPPPAPGDGGKGPGEGGAHLAPERPGEVDVNKWRAERQLTPEVEAERFGRINGAIEKARSGAERAREARPSDSVVAGIRESVAIAEGELELIDRAGPEGVLSEADMMLKGRQEELLLQEASDYRESLDNYHRPHLERLAEAARNTAETARNQAAEAETAASLAASEQERVGEELKARDEEWGTAWAAAMQMPEKYRGGVLSQIKAEKAEIEGSVAAAEEAAIQKKAEAEAMAAEANRAEAERSECEATVRHIEMQMEQAKIAAMQIEDELNRSHQISQETVQRGERLRAHIEEGQQVERAAAAADDVEAVRKAFELVGGNPLPPGIEADLMNAVRGGLTGQEIGLHNYLVPLMRQINPETGMNYGDQSANYLLEILGERAKQMQRVLTLTVAESPDEVMQRMVEMTGVPRLPESFRQAVEAARQGRGYHQEVGPGSVEALRQMADLQGQAYFEVLRALGYKPESPLSAQEEAVLMEKAQSGGLKQQFAADVDEIIQGNLLRGAETAQKLGEAEEKLAAAKLEAETAGQKIVDLSTQLAAAQAEGAAGADKAVELQTQLAAAQDEAKAAQEKADRAQQRVGELEPVAGEAQGQITVALESAVRDLGSAVIPDGLKAPLVAGETLAYRLAAIEGWRQDELEKQLQENKRQLGVNPETDKAGDGKEHEKSVKRVDDILTKFQAGEANDKAVQSTLNELRQVPGIGPAMAEVFSKMVSRLQANRGSLSDNDITESIGKDSNLRKLLGAPELAGIGAGAMAGMLPLFEGMFNTALASMGLAGR